MASVQKITLQAIAERTQRFEFKALVREDGSTIFSRALEVGKTISPEEFHSVFGEYGHFLPQDILSVRVIEEESDEETMLTTVLEEKLMGTVEISITIPMGSGGHYWEEVKIPPELKKRQKLSESNLEQLKKLFGIKTLATIKGMQEFWVMSIVESDK